MIEAVLIAVGLVTGPFHVALEFSSQPHAVEIFLDGEKVAEIEEEPWEARFDLGEELTPHELVVVSRDADGVEIDRETRWLNVHLADPWPKATPFATPVAVLLDHRRKVPGGLEGWFQVSGRPAEVVDVTYPPAEVWIVRDPKVQLEIDRAGGLAVGGEIGWRAPPGNVLRRGRDATLEYFSQNANFIVQAKYRFDRGWDRWLELFRFDEGSQVRFVSPWGAPVSQISRPHQIFGATRSRDMFGRGLLYYAYATRPLNRWFRLADAVGIAGLESTAAAARRAVILMTADPEFPDDSLYAPSDIRRYLAGLGVPLFVWSFQPDKVRNDLEWGPVRKAAPAIGNVGSMTGEPGYGYLRDFEFEYFQVLQTLLRQRIVWIHGHHLPGEISLSADAHGVRLVSSVESWPLHDETIEESLDDRNAVPYWPPPPIDTAFLENPHRKEEAEGDRQ